MIQILHANIESLYEYDNDIFGGTSLPNLKHYYFVNQYEYTIILPPRNQEE